MKTICLLGLVAACALAAGLVSASSSDDRELRELVRRVDKLERSQDEASRAVDRLAKSVADLERSIRSSGSPSGDTRDLVNRGDKQDKRLTELEKRVEEISKALAEIRKQVAPKSELFNAIHKKIDGRTMQMAKWFDEYHPKKAVGTYHRDEINRIK